MIAKRPEALDLAVSDPRGEGIPIVFVHGFSHNRSVWQSLANDLAPGWRPILPDLRGHGESPWSLAGDYDLHDYASDLPRLLDRLGVERVHLVGHSLGGNVSTLFASAWPERVASLVLVDTGPELEAAGSQHIAGEVETVLRSFASTFEYRAQLAAIHPNGDAAVLDVLASTGLVKRIDGRFEPALDPGVLGDADVEVDMEAIESELWIALESIRCPVLVVRGALTAILSPPVAQRMVDEVLADGRLVTLSNAGHAVMIDDGPGLGSAIGDFLAPLPAL